MKEMSGGSVVLLPEPKIFIFLGVKQYRYQ